MGVYSRNDLSKPYISLIEILCSGPMFYVNAITVYECQLEFEPCDGLKVSQLVMDRKWVGFAVWVGFGVPPTASTGTLRCLARRGRRG